MLVSILIWKEADNYESQWEKTVWQYTKISMMHQDPSFVHFWYEISIKDRMSVQLYEALHNEIILDSFVGVSRRYTDHYQGWDQAIRPTATLINIHEPLI